MENKTKEKGTARAGAGWDSGSDIKYATESAAELSWAALPANHDRPERGGGADVLLMDAWFHSQRPPHPQTQLRSALQGRIAAMDWQTWQAPRRAGRK